MRDLIVESKTPDWRTKRHPSQLVGGKQISDAAPRAGKRLTVWQTNATGHGWHKLEVKRVYITHTNSLENSIGSMLQPHWISSVPWSINDVYYSALCLLVSHYGALRHRGSLARQRRGDYVQ